MKGIKKILAVMVAMVMTLGLTAANVFAEGETTGSTITINRDDSWQSSETEDRKATYTYYKIFDADITEAATVDPKTGASTGGNVVYTISGDNAKAKVDALPEIFTAKLAADGKYYITLTDKNTGAEAIVTALKEMVAANKSLFPGKSETSASNPVVLNVGTDGYYLIEASNGKDLAVQTIGNVEINEKNDYPTIDKQQKKDAGETFVDTTVEAEIGKVIDYKIVVHIPADANKAIYVVDKMSAGLTYNGNYDAKIDGAPVTSVDMAATDPGYVSPAPEGYTIPFQKKFADTIVSANRGKDIVITYTATVNANALVPTGRENEAKLVYDEGNYVLKDKVEYTTYFTGIVKVDGADENTKLENVKFTITVGGKAYNVTKSGDYYIPGGDSNEVITDANGLIIIRGLDNTKTYTLTETETKPGYNLLETPKNLVLVEDNSQHPYATTTFDKVVNNKGTVLPSTGGIGTTIFYAIGSILVVGAGVLLISKKRMFN